LHELPPRIPVLFTVVSNQSLVNVIKVRPKSLPVGAVSYRTISWSAQIVR